MRSTIAGETILRGIPISEGVAMGVLYFLKPNEEFSVPEFTITTSQVNHEIGRYHEALSTSREELEKLQFFLQKEGATEAMSIIDSHIQMLDDPLLTSGMEEKISQMLQNTESVFQCVLNDYKSVFDQVDSPEIQERFSDVQDLSNRILKHLHPSPGIQDNESQGYIPSHSILCSYELIPTQTAAASPNHIQAFVTEIGGKTSHAALIAKSKGIPYISNIDVKEMEEYSGSVCIIDGDEGLMIINPSEETKKEYSQKKKSTKIFLKDEIKALPSIPKTQDGVEIAIQANLESIHDLRLLKEYNVESIGLLRSEFLYLRKEIKDFREDEQYDLYKKFIKLAKGIEVTFRVFDIGSDKKFFRSNLFEPNPALGCRSIRFLMKHPEMFSSQIRAILRAAIYGNVKLLLPLISDVQELIEAKEFINKEIKQLKKEGVSIPESISIGCMVEVPAFVIMCDKLIPLCDFLSIGTNDLVQYTLVADRSNPRTCDKYGPIHPSILRMIEHVTKEADKYNVPISICGEMASNPQFAKLLIGLGIRSLSCSPRFIPLLKYTVSKIDSIEASKLASDVLNMSTITEIKKRLNSNSE